jgi:hypothetical protein
MPLCDTTNYKNVLFTDEYVIFFKQNIYVDNSRR